MNPVPSVRAGFGAGYLDELGSDQLIEQVPGASQGLAEKRGTQPARERRRLPQRQPPEQPPGLLSNALVAERDTRPNAHVCVREFIQATRLIR